VSDDTFMCSALEAEEQAGLRRLDPLESGSAARIGCPTKPSD